MGLHLNKATRPRFVAKPNCAPKRHSKYTIGGNNCKNYTNLGIGCTGKDEQGGACCARYDWVLNPKQKDWVCVSCIDNHPCPSGAATPSKKHGSSAFTAADLVPLVLVAATSGIFKRMDVKSYIEPAMFREPGEGLIQ